MVEQQTSIPTCFQFSPVGVKEDFTLLDSLVKKDADLPIVLKFFIFYDYDTTKLLYNNTYLAAINHCVVYIPTPWFLDVCLREAYKAQSEYQSFGTAIAYSKEIPNNTKSQLKWIEANMKEMRTVMNLRLHGQFKYKIVDLKLPRVTNLLLAVKIYIPELLNESIR